MEQIIINEDKYFIEAYVLLLIFVLCLSVTGRRRQGIENVSLYIVVKLIKKKQTPNVIILINSIFTLYLYILVLQSIFLFN